eukprot:6960540-Ditylum_brightwellii.AAC.1
MHIENSECVTATSLGTQRGDRMEQDVKNDKDSYPNVSVMRPQVGGGFMRSVHGIGILWSR